MKTKIIQNGREKLVRADHARILVAIGKASYPEVERQAKPQASAAPGAPEKSADRQEKQSTKPAKRKTYRRRDLRAED